MAIKTITGNRPDLAGVVVNQPTEYIGNIIYPSIRTMQKAGNITYQALTADSVSQTNRSAGAAPTAVIVGASSQSFSCTENIKRYGVDYADAEMYGDIAIVDNIGAMAAKRSVMRAKETAAAAKLITATRYSAAENIGSAILAGLQAAATSVKRYKGKLALVASNWWYQSLLAEAEIKAWLVACAAGTTMPGMLFTPDMLKNLLQNVFKFDQVLIGDDDHWKVQNREDAAAVVMLPDPMEFSHKLDPILGKTVVFYPEDGQEFEMSSYYDEQLKTNMYDATMWYNIIEFNAAAAKLVKGVGSTATT